MELRVNASLAEISAEKWDALVSPDFPFARHQFLLALETSRSVGARAGWLPCYLAVWRKQELLGATYLYIKSHSQGEYIFDWAWAHAYEQHGFPYYPKLCGAVPFTPATGRKLMVRPGEDRSSVTSLLLQGARRLADESKASSIHFLFIPSEEIQEFESHDFSLRHSLQFHWRNRGYQDFTDFLKALKPRKAKQIAREREQLEETGVEIFCFTGASLTHEHAHLMNDFYLTTAEKYGAIPYLTPKFFETVFSQMAENVVLWLAKRQDRWIAASLNFRSGRHLYGRYWGATEEVRNLHFELCYYRTVEYAIQHKLTLFEAGAQGSHKIPRGFIPEYTYSAHWIRHPEFRRAIDAFLREESHSLRKSLEEFTPHLPYRESEGKAPT